MTADGNGFPMVEVKDLVKTYGPDTPNPVQALRGVSFAIPRGRFAALMGHSGSGKSTLLNLLGCLDRPTSGCCLLEGVDPAALSRRERARLRAARLGFVFQSFHLLPRMTARANVELPLLYLGGISARARRERAEQALIRVGLKDKLSRHPPELSGGQQQRVAIARAIVNRPALLLADEPTGNLDTRTGLEIMALLQELHAAGLTIAMVTHEVDVAEHAEVTLVLRDGRIVQTLHNKRPRSAATELQALPVENSADRMGGTRA